MQMLSPKPVVKPKPQSGGDGARLTQLAPWYQDVQVQKWSKPDISVRTNGCTWPLELQKIYSAGFERPGQLQKRGAGRHGSQRSDVRESRNTEFCCVLRREPPLDPAGQPVTDRKRLKLTKLLGLGEFRRIADLAQVTPTESDDSLEQEAEMIVGTHVQPL